MIADQTSPLATLRAVNAALATHAARVARDKLPDGRTWPEPLARPGEAAPRLEVARQLAQVCTVALAQATEAVTHALDGVRTADGTRLAAQTDLDELRATRARQLDEGARSGIVPDGMVSADQLDIGAAHVERLAQHAESLRAEWQALYQRRAAAQQALRVAERDVSIAEVLVEAEALLEPLRALGAALEKLPRDAATKHDQIAFAVERAVSDALTRKQ